MERPHSHSEIEINYSAEKPLDYFLSGRFQSVPPRQLAVFWAGAPHQLQHIEATEMLWITLPLSWFLQWNLDETFTRRLLEGELLVQPLAQPLAQPLVQSPSDIEYSIVGERRDDERHGDETYGDETLLRRWIRDFRSDQKFVPILLLELEARLRRLIFSLDSQPPTARVERASSNNAQSRQVELLASFLSRHYREPILVEDAAREVGLHPNYAMQVFKNGCGLTLGNYLQRLRLSHAQRLLLTTDWSVARVAEDSGFESLSRFHAVFKAQCDQTPRAFRTRHEAVAN